MLEQVDYKIFTISNCFMKCDTVDYEWNAGSNNQDQDK